MSWLAYSFELNVRCFFFFFSLNFLVLVHRHTGRAFLRNGTFRLEKSTKKRTISFAKPSMPSAIGHRRWFTNKQKSRVFFEAIPLADICFFFLQMADFLDRETSNVDGVGFGATTATNRPIERPSKANRSTNGGPETKHVGGYWKRERERERERERPCVTSTGSVACRPASFFSGTPVEFEPVASIFFKWKMDDDNSKKKN